MAKPALPVRAGLWLLALLLSSLTLVAGGCNRLDPPEQAGELVVAIRDDPVFYQAESAESPASGFQYDLIQAFAADLGVKLRVVPARDADHLAELLTRGEVHFAAAMPFAKADARFRFTKPLNTSRLIIVQHADALPIDEVANLAGRRIEILPGSPAREALGSLEAQFPLTIVENAAPNNDLELLARVAQRQAELAATDSAHFDLAASYYPDLAIAVEIPEMVFYAWAFRADDEILRIKTDDFITRAGRDGFLGLLHDRYFGHIRRLNTLGIERFLEDIQTVLPRYRAEFQQAQELTGIDWRLLAALAYQESKWDPLATSPTQVRGMMMLTEETADQLKVTDRLDVRQSIRGGARYLLGLIEQLPPEVQEPDRTWLALAAYNLGMGHLNGGRHFAVQMNRDPNAWYDMKRVLPLLARPEYYSRLKSGRARGGEAVILVENIRNYYSILSRFEPAYAGISISNPPR